jgi:hypothetical protein
MIPRALVSILLLVSVSPAFSQSVASVPQGVGILQQSLSAAGMSAVTIRSFTASGTITYFWGTQPVEASTTVRARGGDQFRLDAKLPNGVRSVSTGQQGGGRKDADGKLASIPAHNTLAAVIPTFPYPSIAAALGDPGVTISYLGTVDDGGRRLQDVRVTRSFPKAADPDGVLAQLSAIDYFIDSQTLLLAKAIDQVHPKESAGESYPREMQFEGYTAFNGIAVPTVVRERIAGQSTWEFRLTDIDFNSNLTDSDFLLQ